MRRAASLALALLVALPAESAFAFGPAPESFPVVSDGAGAGSPKSDRLTATDRWIVVLRDGTTMEAGTKKADRLGIGRDRTFRSAIRGYSAKLTKDQVEALRTDPDVAAVVPDAVVSMVGQTIPRGIRRVFGPQSRSARIDGSDERVDADVAIVDTGIDASHRDLNVAGGYNCSTTNPAAWGDENGHGTHVAGTTGAIDNGTGVVGVAPGVRLWGVRILNSAGNGLVSWYVCGLDWITAQRDPADPTRPLFEAVNMSVAKTGKDDRNCGLTNGDLIHQAICRLVASGVTVVAAAGNNSFNAAKLIPASYNEVITVSALADTDGMPGGLGGSSCYSWGSYDKDDTFADFSNYGGDVDLIAPGKCIWSTLPGNRYGYSSGTSMAAPHVTGAAALYKASRPLATPAEVKAALRAAGTQDWKTSTDPDGVHEPLLNVARIVALGDWMVDATSPTRVLAGSGDTVQVPVYVIRAEDVTAGVSLSVTGPAGLRTKLAATVVGPGATTTALTVVALPSLAPGVHTLTVRGTVGNVTRTVPVTIKVVADPPATYHALTPVRLLDSRSGNGLTGTFKTKVARTVQVTTRGGVPANATAVTGTLTVTGQTGAGYLYLGPVATSAPTSSTLNFPTGDTRANGVTVALGSGGTLSITYVARTSGRTAHVVFDVTGYFTPDATGATYHALTPVRLLDSRSGNGLTGAFKTKVARTVQVTNRGGVPANATAVTGTLTVTGQTGAGYLYLGPVATSAPTSSTLNFPTGDTRANGVTVALGSGGTLSITYVARTSGRTAHVVFDVTGYFTPDATGATYHALTPVRLLDSRSGNGLTGTFKTKVARTVQVTTRGGVPANATAVTGTLTVTGQTGAGYLYLGPVATSAPTSSTLNFPTGDTRANGVTVALGLGGHALDHLCRADQRQDRPRRVRRHRLLHAVGQGPASSPRRMVFSRAWAAAATHVVMVVILGTSGVVILGTSGRLRVDLDASSSSSRGPSRTP